MPVQPGSRRGCMGMTLQWERRVGRGGRGVRHAEMGEETDAACDCCRGPGEDSAGSRLFKRFSLKTSMPAEKMQHVGGSSG